VLIWPRRINLHSSGIKMTQITRTLVQNGFL